MFKKYTWFTNLLFILYCNLLMDLTNYCLLTEAATMSISVAQLRHIFGLQRDVIGNVAYYDEQTIVYPSGISCVLYNIDQKQQKFIQGSEKSRVMTAMALSQNRRYVAFAERGDKEKGE